MESLVERSGVLSSGVSSFHLPIIRFSLGLLVLSVGSNRHIELGDLVSVLARCGDLDRSSPVEVEMAKSVGKLLDVNLGQIGVVLGHEEMRGENAALVG